MKELVECIAKFICDDIDVLEVTEIIGETSSIIEVRVSQDDLGKMIGKGGKTAQSIRNLIYSSSHKFNKRYVLELMAI